MSSLGWPTVRGHGVRCLTNRRSRRLVTRVESQTGGRRRKGDPAVATLKDAQLRQILHTIPVLAFCTLADGANEFTNKRWQDYTGLSQQDTSGWGWQVAIH